MQLLRRGVERLEHSPLERAHARRPHHTPDHDRGCRDEAHHVIQPPPIRLLRCWPERLCQTDAEDEPPSPSPPATSRDANPPDPIATRRRARLPGQTAGVPLAATLALAALTSLGLARNLRTTQTHRPCATQDPRLHPTTGRSDCALAGRIDRPHRTRGRGATGRHHRTPFRGGLRRSTRRRPPSIHAPHDHPCD